MDETADFQQFFAPVESPAVAANLVPGSMLAGRYRIIQCLGEGGMGAVYKAHDDEVDRLVAIKVIRRELASDPGILQRFKQELILARQVTHRNVVRIFDLGVAAGIKFISMEFIEGRELTSLLEEQGKLLPKQAADIMLQVCRGLAAAHGEGVVHRDLKPQNIMIDNQGRAAVMDFGIASSVTSAPDSDAPTLPTGIDNTSKLTVVGSLIGTPRYMSPEQARGEPVDARSDVFTVGLIFYELLTGILPFRGKSGKETLEKRLNETPKPPIDLDPRIPKALNQIVMKCLERDAEKRYRAAGEVVHDLEIWLGIRNTVRAADVRRMRWMAAGLATLLIAASGFIIYNQVYQKPVKAHDPVKLLIADIANRTGDSRLDGALEPMFQSALEQASFVSSYNRGTARKIAAQLKPDQKYFDESAARLVALREGIGIVVSGTIEKQGSDYRLQAKAVNANNGESLVDRAEDLSDLAMLPTTVNQLASRIRRTLGDRTSSSTTEAETFTSASLEAARLYAQAQDLQWAGKWDASVSGYKQAIEKDPNLSRAYSGMAATLANLGRRQEAEQYYQLALTHTASMSEREKYRTRGGYYLLNRDYQKAAEQFKSLVSQYPADTAGIANLALAYFYERNMGAALNEGQRAVDIYPNNLLQRNNLGLYAMYAGDFDRAIRESNEILKQNPAFEKAYLCIALSALGKGDEAASEAAYRKLGGFSSWGASEEALGLADLADYRGRTSEAATLLEGGIRSDILQKESALANKKRVVLAGVEIQRHRISQAVRSAEGAAKEADDESILYPAAMVLLEAGQSKKALDIAEKLSTRFGPEARATGKLIEAEAQLKAGKVRQAINSFQEAQKVADTWLGRYGLGRAYLAAELYPDADSEFDVCLKRRGEAAAVFLDDDPSMRYLPAVYYYQGVAREGLKSPAAADSYQRYIAIRQSAENDPLLADAKRRLK
jgi:Flp pilus assembly protein TadD